MQIELKKITNKYKDYDKPDKSQKYIMNMKWLI